MMLLTGLVLVLLSGDGPKLPPPMLILPTTELAPPVVKETSSLRSPFEIEAAVEPEVAQDRQRWLANWLRLDWLKRNQADAGKAKLRLPAPTPPSDALLVTRCRAVLLQDRQLGGSTIHVTAEHGVITLLGSVRSDEERARAQLLAEKTVGVKQVDNQIKRTGSAQTGTPKSPVTLGGPRPLPASPAPAMVANQWLKGSVPSQSTGNGRDVPAPVVAASAVKPDRKIIMLDRHDLPTVVSYVALRSANDSANDSR